MLYNYIDLASFLIFEQFSFINLNIFSFNLFNYVLNIFKNILKIYDFLIINLLNKNTFYY